MAFNNKKFYKMDTGWSEDTVANWYKYKTTDSRVTVNTSGYFPTTLNFNINDVIYSVSDEGPQILYVVTNDPVTVADLVDATVDIPADSVGTEALQDDAVVEAKIHPGSVTKGKLGSDVTTFVGIKSDTLTAASTSTVTVTGALTTDHVWAQLTEAPTSVDKGIVGAKVTSADTVTLYCEGIFDAIGCMVFVVRPAV